ncbi:MAG: glycosyltransferase [Saprospiraceae bacterium]|nr:glycosyltransferase [Saprospiraceae bacterium]
MARELAKNHRVIYVNHPYSIKDVVFGLLKGDPWVLRRCLSSFLRRNNYETLDSIPENFLAVHPPMTLPINWLPPGRLYNLLQRWNNHILLRSIRWTLQRENVDKYLYINCYNPFFAGWLPKEMGAVASIYHCIDDITQDAYTARHGYELENEACRNADITLVTSTNLTRLKKPVARRLVTYFNAADIRVFEKVRTTVFPRPAELDQRPQRVIGYIGNLDALRIDYPLLKQTALAYPDCTLLLVGPLNSSEPAVIGLDQLPNVVFTGSRNLDALPPFLQHMDCVLIPFLCNTLTESIYPLKINEYLAAGKPVVSTEFSEDIRSFAPVIYLSSQHADFIRNIQTALQENNPDLIQKRVEIAQSNTWEARIRQLWEILPVSETSL